MASGEEKSYPAVLQTLLGDGFCVNNFGRSGATVINDFKQALLSEPEIVILMLGMNDANPTHHFNAENNGKISTFYMVLYREVLKNFTENLKILRRVQEEVAICKKVCLIDTCGKMQEAGYYRDDCHLTYQGYEQLAKAIYTSISGRR